MSDAHCAYCRDSFSAAPPVECGGCRTVLHAECWAEARACPTLGCGERPAAPPTAPAGWTRLEGSYPGLTPSFRGVSRLVVALLAIFPCGITWFLPFTGEAALSPLATYVCIGAGIISLGTALTLFSSGLVQALADRKLAKVIEDARGTPVTWTEAHWSPSQALDRRSPRWPLYLGLATILATGGLLPLQWEPPPRHQSWEPPPKPHTRGEAVMIIVLPLSVLWGLTIWGLGKLERPAGRVRFSAPLLLGASVSLEVELPARLATASELSWSLRRVRRVVTESRASEDTSEVLHHEARSYLEGTAPARGGRLSLELALPAGAPPTKLPAAYKYRSGEFWELVVSAEGKEALYTLPIF